ncbi:receptor [Rubneribacter badeniensis]|uniref:Receptor n=1 Tax=Rubneribacter badeniensis TaxID=2070688 RepID=A0A2K2U5F3_9ACTN|nr:receptor [Rubneribacter badeniensis]PNV65537.1 receptor [Rubneribacter badeniensis]
MASNVFPIASIAFLAVALCSAAGSVLEHGLAGLRGLGKATWTAFGAYALAFAGFLATQGL